MRLSFQSSFIVDQFENVNVCIFVKGACYDSSRIWIFSQIVWVSHWFLASRFNCQSKISCCFVQCRMTQNSKSTHATILQLLVAKFATQSWRYCNPKLKSHYAICSCSYSDYQLKKIATKSCLQLKLAIHAFLQLLVELWLHSGCKNLQCILANNFDNYGKNQYSCYYVKDLIVT